MSFSQVDARARQLRAGKNLRYTLPKSYVPSGRESNSIGELNNGLRRLRNTIKHRVSANDANDIDIRGSSIRQGPLLTRQELQHQRRYVQALRNEVHGRKTFLTNRRGLGNQPSKTPGRIFGSIAQDINDEFFRQRNRVNDIRYGFDQNIRNLSTGEYLLDELKNHRSNPFKDENVRAIPSLPKKDPNLIEQRNEIGDYSIIHRIQENNGQSNKLVNPILSRSEIEGAIALTKRQDPNIEQSRFRLFPDPIHHNRLVETTRTSQPKHGFYTNSLAGKEREIIRDQLMVKTPLEAQRKKFELENNVHVNSNVFTPKQLHELRQRSKTPKHEIRELRFHPSHQISRMS